MYIFLHPSENSFVTLPCLFFIIVCECMHEFSCVVLCLWANLSGPGVLEIMNTEICVIILAVE